MSCTATDYTDPAFLHETSHYMSFAEQTRHYFGRAHVGVPEASLQHPSAWTGHALREDASAWLVELSDADIKEIRAAVDRVLVADLSLGEVGREQFELPHLADRVRTWRDRVHEGIGFILVRGLPVDEWTEYELSVAFWGLGHHLGVPGAQNPDEELLGHVKDYGEAQDDPFVRLYRTRQPTLISIAMRRISLACCVCSRQKKAGRAVSSAQYRCSTLC